MRDAMDDDAVAGYGEFITSICHAKLTAQGYEPAGPPEVTWHQVTREEWELLVAAMVGDGLPRAEAAARLAYEPGDWIVRVATDTTRHG
jgi:hypothetical protein